MHSAWPLRNRDRLEGWNGWSCEWLKIFLPLIILSRIKNYWELGPVQAQWILIGGGLSPCVLLLSASLSGSCSLPLSCPIVMSSDVLPLAVGGVGGFLGNVPLLHLTCDMFLQQKNFLFLPPSRIICVTNFSLVGGLLCMNRLERCLKPVATDKCWMQNLS